MAYNNRNNRGMVQFSQGRVFKRVRRSSPNITTVN